VNEREQYISNLRAYADWIEDHPQVPIGLVRDFNVFVSKEEAQSAVKGSGKWEKGTTDIYSYFDRKIGSIRHRLYVERKMVCERNVVGTKIVPEHEEEIVEWVCKPILAEGTEVAEDSVSA
jgi:hypothetical protein